MAAKTLQLAEQALHRRSPRLRVAPLARTSRRAPARRAVKDGYARWAWRQLGKQFQSAALWRKNSIIHCRLLIYNIYNFPQRRHGKPITRQNDDVADWRDAARFPGSGIVSSQLDGRMAAAPGVRARNAGIWMTEMT